MNPIQALWRIKGQMLRMTAPILFRRVGAGTMFIGKTRLPLPFQRVSIGRKCIVNSGVYFHTGRTGRIEVGDQTSFNTGCHIVASEAIEIGERVAIGEYVSIRDQDHNFTPATGVRGQGYRVAPIVIEDNVWIGRGVHIGPGTHIRSGTIVAANAVVRGAHPRNVLLAGLPASPRRTILPTGETIPFVSDAKQDR